MDKLLAQRIEAMQPAKGAKAPPELTASIAKFSAVVKDLQSVRLAISRQPKPIRDAFILHGRIVDAAGNPVPKATVSLTDAQGLANKLIKPVKTDENGFYTITLRAGEYPDLVKADEPLFVTVVDAKKRELAKPPDAIPIAIGKVAILDIR
jgi:protocatechuate 3,4-dioxygenase beta subunit